MLACSCNHATYLCNQCFTNFAATATSLRYKVEMCQNCFCCRISTPEYAEELTALSLEDNWISEEGRIRNGREEEE